MTRMDGSRALLLNKKKRLIIIIISWTGPTSNIELGCRCWSCIFLDQLFIAASSASTYPSIECLNRSLPASPRRKSISCLTGRLINQGQCCRRLPLTVRSSVYLRSLTTTGGGCLQQIPSRISLSSLSVLTPTKG